MLSQRALELLTQLFNEQSNLNLPAGVARQVVEIETFAKAELAKIPKKLDETNDLVKQLNNNLIKRGRPSKHAPVDAG